MFKMPKEIPDIIRALERRINDWRYSGEVMSIVPKAANFDEMYFFKKGLLWSMDRKSIFVGMVNIVPQDQVTWDTKKLYQKLKGMECELERGFMWRNLHFRLHSDLIVLKKRIPTLELDDAIVRGLNNDTRLMTLLSTVKPEILTIILSTAPGMQMATREDLHEAAAKYYNNPLRITWEMAITKIVERGLRYEKTINGIFDAFDLIATVLRENSIL